MDTIVAQHVENAAALRTGRSGLVRAPHVNLFQLARQDERLEANLDGVFLSGEVGAKLSFQGLDPGDVGGVFVAAFCAAQSRDPARLDHLVTIARESPNAARGLTSLLGWLSPEHLRGLAAGWLSNAEVFPRLLGLCACALHRADPGPALPRAIEASDPLLARRALQAAGELGRIDLLPLCIARLNDQDERMSFQAAQTGVLLGDRARALTVLSEHASRYGQYQRSALATTILAGPAGSARDLVRQLSADEAPARLIIEAIGLSGDAAAVPWLIRHFADDHLARVAGEAFSFITGADLSVLRLERKAPQLQVSGPSDDPADDDVALDADENLPWPDLKLAERWWEANKSRLPPEKRCFLGAVPTPEHLDDVLATGTQRQRAAAALLQVLSRPGRTLFNIAAPAKRQRAWLRPLAMPAGR